MSSRPQRCRAALALLPLLAMGSCGFTPRSGPTASAILSAEGDIAYEVVEVTAASIAPYAMPARGAIETGPQSSARAVEYAIAPGDVLNVVIFERSDGGLFAPAASGGTNFPALRVDASGSVALPYAGRVRVGGLSLAAAAERVTGALAQIAVDPRVHVQLVSSVSHSVLVTGEVRTPGRITLLDGPLSAVDAIARAGGPSQAAHGLDVVIRNQGATRRIPYQTLLAHAGTGVGRGDQIFLEARERRFLTLGAVQRPGLQPMTLARISLLDGIGLAGGLNDERASPSGVFVFRLPEIREATPIRSTVFHFDMRRGETMLLAQLFALREDDVVYVSNAPLWEVQKAVAPFLRLTFGAVLSSRVGGFGN